MKSVTCVSRNPLLLFIFIFLFISLACTCNLSTLGVSTPTAIPTAIPPAIPTSIYTPEEQANAGTHTYHQVAEEFNCTADMIEKDLHISVTFSPGSVEVIPLETPTGGHVFDRVSTNNYSRTDDSGSPVYVITITFHQDGFVMYSEYTEDNGQTYLPCIRYTRTRLD